VRTAVLLSAGTELTEGVIVNTHFRFLGSALKSLGISVLKGVQVPDDRRLFEDELSQALRQAELVIVTGGLGPTSDDLTREVVAAAAHVQLEFREELWAELVERLSLWGRSGGRPIAPANRRQAYIPAGFQVLPNPRGTAPGFFGAVGDALVAALPGPPGELEPMFYEQLVPRIAPQGAPGAETELVAHVLMTSESVLEQVLQELRSGSAEYRDLRWGTRVADDRIGLSLRGGTAESRTGLFAALQAELGPLLVRRGDRRPVEALFETLRARGLRVSFAESCTGGLLCKLLTDLPGSSQLFWGGIVAYANEAKTELLGVEAALLERFGAVSREVADAMSQRLLALTGTDLGVAVTGIAGPEGGSAEKPVGTVWISGRSATGGHVCIGTRLRGSRDSVRRRSAVAALLVADCLLSGEDPSSLGRLAG
jgi:nicotinamide-nucleotide amidase